MRIITLLFLIVLVSSAVKAQDWEKTFWDLYDEGDIYYYAYDFESALTKFEKAYEIAVDHLTIYEVYRGVHAVFLTHEKLTNYDELKTTIRGALKVHKQEFTEDQISLLYRYLARAELDVSNYQLASSLLDTSLAYAEQGRDTLNLGRVLVNISINNIYLNRFDEVLTPLDRANALNISHPQFESSLSLNYYNAYDHLNESYKGFKHLMEAYEYAKESNNLNAYTNVLLLLSSYHRRQNNYREALAFATEGMALAKGINQPPFIANFSENFGRIYTSLNAHELAISYFTEALKIYEQSDNDDMINKRRISIADLLIYLDETELAEEILLDVLSKEENRYSRIGIYLFLSEIEIKRENYQSAKNYLDTALSGLDSNMEFKSWLLYDQYLSLPTINDEEKLDFALKVYQMTKELNERNIMSAEFELARVYEPLDQDSAFKYVYSAFEKLENRRLSTSASTIKNQLTADWQSYYYLVADWEVKYNQDFDKAFELFELSKSRTLFDQIFENQATELMDPENPNTIKVLELQKRIDQLYQRLGRDEYSEDYESNLLQLSTLELEYQTEVDALINSNSDLKNFEYPSVSTLDEVQALLDEETGYLSYGSRGSELFVFLVTEENEIFKSISVGKNALESLSVLVNNFRDAIINVEAPDVLKEYSDQIRPVILDPILEELEGINHLLISPEGPLHLLPFDALVLNHQYLVERFSVKYLPSMSLYNVIEYPDISNFEKELLAVAGSGFESGDGFIGSSSQSAFATLPYSLAEVDSISNYFTNSTLLRNEEVSEFAVKSLTLSDYRFVHLATHGNIDERLPDQSGLILSKKIGTESLFGEDGYLNAREISQLDIPAELVVLSACNTGTGKVINGEGVMGLQRAMLVAGASSVMVSLWNIFDRSTPLFMDKFYNQLLKIEDEEISFLDTIKMYVNLYKPDIIDYKTLALQQAKLEMINHPYYNHPVHWAPFILTGK